MSWGWQRGMSVNWIRGQLRLLAKSYHARRAIDREIADDAVIATVRRIFWTAPIMAAGTSLSALGFWLRSDAEGAAEILWRDLIIRTNAFSSLITICLWFLAWLIRARYAKIRIQKVFIYTVVAFVLASGLLISLVDHLVMPSITPFLLCVTIVGTFYYLPPVNSIVVYLAAFFVFRSAFLSLNSLSQTILDSALVNGQVACAVGLALSIVNWQHYRRSKLQERTIVRQRDILTRMAYHDALTGLPNRRYLDELVEKEVELVKNKAAESCLIMCDVDNFKTVNDTHGHPAGDELLRQFSLLMREAIGNANTIVRLGGEEFVILTPHTSLADAAALAECLRETISAHSFSLGQDIKIRITASFGVAALQGTEGIRDYYLQADEALYRAKQAGKNYVAVACCLETQSSIG